VNAVRARLTQEEFVMQSDLQKRATRGLLRGKVLRRTEADVSGGVSGVFSSFETKHALFLFEDGTFSYEVTEFRSVSSEGLSIPSEDKRTRTGSWDVLTPRGVPSCSSCCRRTSCRWSLGVLRTANTGFSSWTASRGTDTR
jgi:hypothetical protein